MKIAVYAQKLLEMGVQAASSLEPITFCGMFDSGVDYLFTLSAPLYQAELPKDIINVFVDLSGLTTAKETAEELSFALSENLPKMEGEVNYNQLTRSILKNINKHKLVLVLYLGQDGKTDLNLFYFLNRLRNLLGWRFSYTIFTTTHLLFDQNYSLPLIDKVVKRNVIPVLPRNANDSLIILANYEERYRKQLTDKQQKQAVSLSGGNSGLIKALYLQAVENPKWEKADFLDERLFYRLSGIANDMPKEFKKAFLNHGNFINTREFELLTRYGYLVQQDCQTKPFSPLLPEFIKKYAQQVPHQAIVQTIDQKILNLSLSQRKVLDYLEQHPGIIVSKDTIAQVLWGEGWEEKYSDWAIDQLLYTLREKLIDLKYKGKLVTKKGEGIIYVPQ